MQVLNLEYISIITSPYRIMLTQQYVFHTSIHVKLVHLKLESNKPNLEICGQNKEKLHPLKLQQNWHKHYFIYFWLKLKQKKTSICKCKDIKCKMRGMLEKLHKYSSKKHIRKLQENSLFPCRQIKWDSWNYPEPKSSSTTHSSASKGQGFKLKNTSKISYQGEYMSILQANCKIQERGDIQHMPAHHILELQKIWED